MKNSITDAQKQIKVGTHGENYGSWMSNPVFYVETAETIFGSKQRAAMMMLGNSAMSVGRK